MAEQYPKSYFQREDENSDHYFYTFARKVVHIDEGAIYALSSFYAEHLPKNGIYLDLMSSWRSHLPKVLASKRVYGLGMNDVEMAENPQLDEHVVHDLNKNPILPYKNKTFNAVVCAVSIQYLTQPVEVFKEVRRVLKTRGVFIISFSNRCFPTKAVSVWLTMGDRQRLALVKQYFEVCGGWSDIQTESKTSSQHDPMFFVYAKKSWF